MKEMWPFNNLFKNKIEKIDIDNELIDEEELVIFDMSFQEDIKKKKINLNTKVDEFIKEKKDLIKELNKKLNEYSEEISTARTEQINKIEKNLYVIQNQIDDIKRQYYLLKQNEKIGNNKKKQNPELNAFSYDFKIEEKDIMKEFIISCQKNLKQLLQIIDYKEFNKKDLPKTETLKIQPNKQLEKNQKKQEQYMLELNKNLKKFHDKEDQLYLYGLKNMSKVCLMLMNEYRDYNDNDNLVLGGLLLNNNLRSMRNLMSEHKQMYLDYKNYVSKKEMNNEVNNLLNDTINQVDLLQHEFEYNYWEYKEVIPTYSIIYERLEFIKNQLYKKNVEINQEG